MPDRASWLRVRFVEQDCHVSSHGPYRGVNLGKRLNFSKHQFLSLSNGAKIAFIGEV